MPKRIAGVCTHCAGPATLSPRGDWSHDDESCFTTTRPEAKFMAPGEENARPVHKRGKR